jgi:GTPase SAR1 family protein
MDTHIKILVVGNSGVGKTSLCNRYINERYLNAYKPTVGGVLFNFSFK